MNLLRAATLVVADPDATAARYTEWFGYEVEVRGAVDIASSRSWGAPAAAGARYVVSRPASGAEIFLRFVAGEAPEDYRPLRTFGWAALELCVADVEALHDRLIVSPFEVIGPPRLLDSMPEIYPMQVRGPDNEIIFLTEIRGDQSGIILPRARSLVDSLFILVAGCSDVAASFAWFERTLGLRVGIDAEITYTMLTKAFDLPSSTRHRIITGVHGTDCFLECDQYPKVANKRPNLPEHLPPGMALATFSCPDLSQITQAWLSPPARRDGPLYNGARVGVLKGPDGILMELVETG